MRKILDKIFANQKVSVWVPIVWAGFMYLLYLAFGNAPDKVNVLIMTPVMSLIWFWGVYLVIYIQVKNLSCPEWFLNLFELLALAVFGVAAVTSGIGFLIHLIDGFSPAVCLGPVTWSAVSFVHGKRKED